MSFYFQSGGQDQERKHKKRRGEFYSIQTSLIVAALKKMLPIGLNMCTPGDQELISLAKTRYALVRLDSQSLYDHALTTHLVLCVWGHSQNKDSSIKIATVNCCLHLKMRYLLPTESDTHVYKVSDSTKLKRTLVLLKKIIGH